MCLCVHTCSVCGGQRLTASIVLYCSPLSILWWSISLKLEFTSSVLLAGILQSLCHQCWDYRFILLCLISCGCCGSKLSSSCLSCQHFTHRAIFLAQFWCFDAMFLSLPLLWNNICSSIYPPCLQTALSYFQIHLFCSWVVIRHFSLDLSLPVSILEFIPLCYFY